MKPNEYAKYLFAGLNHIATAMKKPNVVVTSSKPHRRMIIGLGHIQISLLHARRRYDASEFLSYAARVPACSHMPTIAISRPHFAYLHFQSLN